MQKSTTLLLIAVLAVGSLLVSARASISPSVQDSSNWEHAQVTFAGAGGNCHDIELRDRQLILVGEDVLTFLKEVRERARGALSVPEQRFIGTSRRPVLGDQDLLNLMGFNGYELVTSNLDAGQAGRTLWIFKRPQR